MAPIYWIKDRNPPQLAIVARPRGDDWLRDDLAALKAGGIDVLVSLLEPEEAEELGLAAEAEVVESLGMSFISCPIPDRCTPSDPVAFRDLAARLACMAGRGRRIGAHCRGCIGRSTVLIASVLIALGADADVALRQIEDARGWPVPDTPEQRAWILAFRIPALRAAP